MRRLLENGANSSFVAQVGDKAIAAETLLTRPRAMISRPEFAADGDIPLPRHLFADRPNSSGVEFGDRHSLEKLLGEVTAAAAPASAAPIVGGAVMQGATRVVRNPANGEAIGEVSDASFDVADAAVEAAARGFASWRDHRCVETGSGGRARGGYDRGAPG